MMRAFLRSRDGTTSVELALGFPVLLSFVIGVIEIANLIFLSVALENAVLHASRFGITGSATSGVTRLEQVRGIIEDQTFGRIPPEHLVIDTLVFDQFADIGKPEPFADANGNGSFDEGETYSDVNGNGSWDADMGTAGLGGSGDIVLYRVRYTAPSLTGFMDWATQAVQLTAAVAVRNEPY
ncbi:MAG: pilus assembly protein [Alphaproteobacteria bacterium]|uniref:TadE/TadG family type IV pilus assembly protein n=1 Tax=Pacificispira sp. TaxID=2888761 RepID=UPI001B0ED667|nr:pilus assembly protein [Alphaproteobacteria bacterium]MBO6863081.1 pilus assembly protein [Alphaproteobacteria bacterium]